MFFLSNLGKPAKLERSYQCFERSLILYAFISFSLPSCFSNSSSSITNQKFFSFSDDKVAHRGVILTDIPVSLVIIYTVYLFKHFSGLTTDFSQIINTRYAANIGYLK